VFYNGFILDSAVRPFVITMVQIHLCFRYTWTPARQFPVSATSSSAFLSPLYLVGCYSTK